MRGKVALVSVTILLVFAAAVALVTLRLRERIRDEMLVQKGSMLHAVAHFEADKEGRDPLDLILAMVNVEGVIGIQYYSRAGELVASLPRSLIATPLPREDFIGLGEHDHVTLLQRAYSLDVLFADPLDELSNEPFPLIRSVINLEGKGEDSTGGYAEFLLDGGPTVAAFAELDGHLLHQSLLAFGVGGATILAVLLISLARLQRTNRALAQANRDLTLHLKTAALGSISAHLFHGLKHAVDDLGDADEAASLHAMIQEVLDVIQEQDRGISYDLEGSEVLDFAARPLRTLGADSDVSLSLLGGEDVLLPNRRGNLVILALQNLLRNAIEASPAGRVVECRCSRDGADIRITVTDHGTGIPEDRLRYLFEAGYSSKSGGNGVGLSLSRQLCRLIGGDLRLVRSTVEGTQFEIRVPDEQSEI
jgi:signal transduction histidine kinase